MNLPDNLTDEQIDDLNNKQAFIRDAMPDSWLNYAEELEEAAEALWADSGNSMRIETGTQLDGSLMLTKKPSAHLRSYILLAGLALENVLKGLIIANDAKLISSARLDKTLKSHKLLDLVKRIDGLVLSKDEKRIVQICQDAIPYWGRYPVPLVYQGLQPEKAATDNFHTSFRRLHFRLCKLLYDLLKDGWSSGVGSEILEMHSERYGDTIDIKGKFPWARGD
jgi:hypothetical protein